MDTRLMDLLVCPLCKGPLSHDPASHELICSADRLAFPLRDGMAVMLEAEARSLDAPADTTTSTASGARTEAGAPP